MGTAEAAAGADALAAAMRRAGKPDWEIARAVVAAREYGVLEALLVGDHPETLAEIRRDYVWRAQCRPGDGTAAEELREQLDRQWQDDHPYWSSQGEEVPPAVSAPQLPPRRCRRCQYVVGSPGHQVSCG